MATTLQVVIDCADPGGLSTFWASALGYKFQDPPEGSVSWEDWLREMKIPEEEWNAASAVVDPEGKGPRVYFQRVPEGKVMKNRVHLDLNVGGGPGVPLEKRKVRVDEEAERLVSEGATRVRPVDQRGEYWMVMRDPEGNEFCLQ
jgi:hypothetical protein